MVLSRTPHLSRHVQNSQAVLRELQHEIKVTVNVYSRSCAKTTCRDYRGPASGKRLVPLPHRAANP